MYKKYIAAVAISLSLVGCASVPMGDSKQDAALKTFTQKQNVSGIYIYRNESMGAAVKMDLDVDGKALGQTAAKTYFYTEVAPGKHTVTSKAENTSSVTIDTIAGKLYYIWQEVKIGAFSARTKLSIVSEEEGKKGVLESQLAASK